MRATLIVLDSVGAGAMPDAADWGDAGSDTLGHVAEANVEHEKSPRDERPGTPVIGEPTTPRGPVTQRNPLFSAPQPDDEIALD